MTRDEARERASQRCWASIGVLGGDRSCPVLRDVGHCRECEVVALAAHRLLGELTVSGESLAAADGERDAGPAVESVAAGQPFSVITFETGGQSLALEARRIVEVSTARPVCRVPHRTRAAFLGLVNVQGRLEPCFELASVLALPVVAGRGDPRLIVLGDDVRRCAFFAHDVALREADVSRVGEPPATVSAALETHVRGILRLGDRPWSWLDADRLLSTLERALA